MDHTPLASFLVLVLGVVLSTAGECPANPSTAMQSCAEKINIDLNSAEGHKFITDKEYTNKMCNESKEVNHAVNCMETIYNDCTTSGTMDKDLLVKPESWRMAIKKVCDNKKFLMKNAACIQKNAEDMSTCTNKFSKDATAKLNLKNIDVTTKGGKARETLKIICGLSKNLMTCFDKTLIKNCPKKMETIMNDILYHFLPPICHPVSSDSQATYETVNDNPKGSGTVLSSTLTTMTVAVFLCLRSIL